MASALAKWFFHEYFGIPKDREIFRVGRNFIDYWEDKEKGVAIRRDYGQPLARVNPWAGLLSEPERGDTNTASTNNGDAFLALLNPTTNYGSSTSLVFREKVSDSTSLRSIMDWTLSSGSGAISAIKLYLYCFIYNRTYTVNVHELTQASAFVELQATWNIWKTGSSWATPGGDYSATIVSSTSINAVNTWFSWVLQGTGATNPITGLTWGSNFDLLLKESTDVSGTETNNVYSRDNATNKPYIEITYTLDQPFRNYYPHILAH